MVLVVVYKIINQLKLGKKLDDFSTWAKNDEGFGEKNVDDVSGPDNNGLFSVTALGDAYVYILKDGEWVHNF